LGFVQESTNDVVNINNCAALAATLNTFIPLASALNLPATRADVVAHNSEIAAAFRFPHMPGNQQLNRWRDGIFAVPGVEEVSFEAGPRKTDFRKKNLTIEVGGNRFELRPHTFFQANRFLLEEFVRTVVQEAGPTPKHVLDLFSGSGFFSIPLA